MAPDAAKADAFCKGMPMVMDMSGFNQETCISLLLQHPLTNLTTPLRYGVGCALTFVLALLFEVLRVVNRRLGQRPDGQKRGKSEPLLRGDGSSGLWLRVARSMGHGASIAIAYLLMMIAMTYNVGLFCAVIGGLTIGFFIFSSANEKGPSGLQTVTSGVEPCCE